MYKINFKEPIHVHFMGIGGISMSGLAEILLNENFTVTGSDTMESPLTKHLINKGASIFYGQVATNITDGVGLVVYTAAIKEDNPEFQEVIARNIPVLTRAEFLGQLMTNYKSPIAVSGTHGKTTTTSMVSHILLEGNQDPTISVGGILPAINGNIRVGNSHTFITEACEYTDSFLSFSPTIGIILNVDADHMDYFKDMTHIRNSFHKFGKRLPKDGHLIINGEIDKIDEITCQLDCQIITYGLDKTSCDLTNVSPPINTAATINRIVSSYPITDYTFDYSAHNISYNEAGHISFDLVYKGNYVCRIPLSVAGEHNVSNALSAIAVGALFDLNLDVIIKGIGAFKGTDRRFEYKGMINNFHIIDDYAHHPTEIDATLESVSHFPHEDLWVVFQPHTYTRTLAFFEEFAVSLSKIQHLVITDIYAAREKNNLGITSQMLADRIKELGCDVTYISDFKEIETYFLEHCKKADLLITMGAGNVVDIGTSMLNS